MKLDATTKASPYLRADVLSLWLSYNRHVKSAPKVLVAKDKSWAYDGHTLYEGRVTGWVARARYVTRRGKSVIFQWSWGVYFTSGRTSRTSLESAATVSLAGETWFSHDSKNWKPKLEALRHSFWHHWDKDKALDVAQFLGVKKSSVTRYAPDSRGPTPAERLRTKKQHNDRRAYLEKKALSLIEYHKPEAVAARREEARITNLLNDAKNKLFYTNTAYVKAKSVFDLHTSKIREITSLDRQPSLKDLLKDLYGFEPQEGQMFKRLRNIYEPSPTGGTQGGKLVGRQANNGPWPIELGEWTEGISNPKACQRGWHLTPFDHIGSWSDWGNDLYLAEGSGQYSRNHDKVAYERARLIEYIGDIGKGARRRWAEAQANNLDTKTILNNLYKQRDAVEGTMHMMHAGYYTAASILREEHLYVRRLADKKIPLNK